MEQENWHGDYKSQRDGDLPTFLFLLPTPVQKLGCASPKAASLLFGGDDLIQKG